MKEIMKIAFANMLLMGMLPEKTEAEIVREEEESRRAIAEGRLNPYEVQKQVNEAMKPFVEAEIIKVRPVTYCIDENGQIKRQKKEG